ncbi:MAG: pilus assembly protein TadG [Novosphingobium pentaromativorans]|uniref:Pilus assembly protein TadG n=1 Tax=Novosphingobium pentaromativorans TaxID=205844 RepID=A0A2W5NQL2_9SPHN|nr:pilus assembly protein TadG-related protein [Novosphingobium panipatense]PZQ55801.1 MAG: pilus assembly protein TadG [Novosphingobium pentaromativorans]
MRTIIHQWHRVLRDVFGGVLRDVGGNVLPLAAIGMVVAAAIVGSAIDLSRNFKVENQLQAACDSAVLAARRTVATDADSTAPVNGLAPSVHTVADNYFRTNFNAVEGVSAADFEVSSTDKGQTVDGKASTVLDTIVMRLFGFKNFALGVECTSSMGIGNSDVMMVLDTTGSMAESLGKSTRIAALQAAMKNFYTTVSSATKDTNARVRYGFVPYSSTVNVGKLLTDLDPSYIADSWDYQSRIPIFINMANGTKTGSKVEYQDTSSSTSRGSNSYTQNQCKNNLPSSQTSYSNYGSSSTETTTSGTSPNITVNVVTKQPQRMLTYECKKYNNSYYVYTTTNTRTQVTTDSYKDATNSTNVKGSTFHHWEYRQVTGVDTSTFKTFARTTVPNGNSGASVSYTWGGCIEERSTVNTDSFSYSPSGGISPSAALDINIDSAPTSDAGTKWGPLWPEISYRRAGSSSSTWTRSTTEEGASAGSYCPAKAQLLQEMDQSSFNTYANSLTAVGGTYLDIGMIWGGRMLSPDGIFGNVVNEEPTNGGEVSRHIIFMTDGQMDTSNYVPTAWGMDWWDLRVTKGGSEGDADARHTSRFLAVCEAIKAKGIRVWVIAFTSGLSADLKTCASDDSSYVATNATDLNTAFQEIAKQVGELRITQ